NAPAEELRGDGMMMSCRHGDDRGVHEVQERPIVAVSARAVGPRDRLSLLELDVRDAAEIDIRQSRQDARVFLTQVTYTDDGHPKPHDEFLIPVWFKKGSDPFVRSTLRAVPAKGSDPFLNQALMPLNAMKRRPAR